MINASIDTILLNLWPEMYTINFVTSSNMLTHMFSKVHSFKQFQTPRNVCNHDIIARIRPSSQSISEERTEIQPAT